MKKVLFSLIFSFGLFSAATISTAVETEQATSVSETSEILVETSESTNATELSTMESTSEPILESTTETNEIMPFAETEEESEGFYSPDDVRQAAMGGLYLRSTMQQDFINNIAPDAKVLAKNHGLYASVMIAQAILESNWGRSDLAKAPNNNLFGIKGRYNNQYVLYDTLEWDEKKGKFVKVKAEFKRYPTQGTSLIDNAEKLRYGVSWDPNYYSGTWIENTKSYKDATKALTGTYATDPDYNKKLNQIIEQYYLIQYDSTYKITTSPYSKDVSIKTNTNNNIYSEPFGNKEVIGNAADYRGTQVHLSLKMSDGYHVYYLVDEIGWMPADTFTDSLDTVTKSTFKRLAHVRSDKQYSFYKEPYNTKGAYRVGPTTSLFYNQDVDLIEKAVNNRTKEVFYLVKEQGWVPSSAFDLIYDQEDIKNISKDLSIKPNAGGSVFTRPYSYAGFEIASLVKEHRGKQVHLSQQAKTKNGIYYLADTIGWIHINAFTTSLDTATKKDINLFAKVNGSKVYNFYKEPYNTLGSERTGKNTKPLFNKDVEIIQEALVARTNEKLYLVKDRGWLTSAALVLYPHEETKNISKELSIKPNAGGSVFSKPYTYYGFEKTGLVKEHRGKQVHLSQQAKTKNGIYYLADEIGWIHINALTTSLDNITKKKVNHYGKIKNNKVYNFYKEPYNTLGSERIGTTTKPLFNQDVEIIEEGVVERTNEKLYLVKDRGWLTSAALTLYPEEKIKSISKDLTVKPNAVGSIFSKPYTYYGFEVIGQAKSYRGKQVHLSQQASTKNGIYYLADGIGWIHIGALTTSLDSVTKTSFNRDARVYNKTYSFYSEPFNTLGSERNGKTTNPIKGTDIKVTQKAVSKQTNKTYYLVKNFGWIDQQALLILDIPNYEKINVKETVLPNVKFNVHTEPYPYKGFKVIGNTSSMKMNNKTFTIKRQAHTSNGIYYDVPGYGWVNKQAFSSDVEKFKQVQNLLNRKYSSGNYGVYVKSLKSNASAGVFQDTRYTAASTGKLPAIYYTQKRYNNKSLNPNTKYLYTDAINQMNESYGRGGAGILQNKPFGGMYTIDTILNWTIYYSDNQGANFLGYYAANKFSKPMKQEISQIIGRQWDTPFSITARENGKLMEAIYKQGGNANKYLQNTSFDNQRIPKYLPVKVGHKIGDVFDYRHDVAIVYAKEPYILSVMTKNYQSYESISILSSEIYNILK